MPEAQLVMPYAPEAQARARRSDPETSHEAARQHEASGVAHKRRLAIREALLAAGKPLTPAEIGEATGIDYTETQRRLSEVDSLGLATYLRDPSDPDGRAALKVRCPIRGTITRRWAAEETR